jgi:hypothetical protein
LKNPVSDAELHEAHLANALFDAHRDDPEFGYRFLADEARLEGFEVCDRTVWKVCSEMGWWSVFGKRKSTKKAKAGTPAHDDLVCRDPMARTSCGSRTSPSTAPTRGSSTSVRSRTCSRTGSSDGQSTSG